MEKETEDIEKIFSVKEEGEKSNWEGTFFKKKKKKSQVVGIRNRRIQSHNLQGKIHLFWNSGRVECLNMENQRRKVELIIEMRKVKQMKGNIETLNMVCL